MGKQDAARARAMVRERIEIVRVAHTACDAAVDRELAELAARGVAPSCAKGCVHCCREEIFTPRAEAEAAVEAIRASWSPARLEALRERIRAWLAWYRTEGKRLRATGMSRQAAFYEHGPLCPALEDGACSIYDVRPMTCRTHYVRSPADACRQESDPQVLREQVVVLPSIPRVTQPASLQIRAAVEQQGADFLATVHLLPEWLAHLLRVEDQPWLTTPPLLDQAIGASRHRGS